MIVVRLQGLLGNQMFEYAAGRSLAERLDTELILDSSWIVLGGGDGQMRYELDCFDLGVKVCPVWEVGRVPNTSRVVRALQLLRPSRRPFLKPIYEDSSGAFVPAVLNAPDDTYLLGYWQFQDYFAVHEALIREAFTFPLLSDEGERLAQEIRSVPAVSVHVRRGDYAEHEHLGGLGIDYYRRAADAIAAIAGEMHIFVFSDDPRWCTSHLDFPYPTSIVQRDVSPDRHWEDMRLMSLCQHHVIANSTYSWWAAWLNPSTSKLVVAPDNWVRTSKRIGDPVPENWIRV